MSEQDYGHEGGYPDQGEARSGSNVLGIVGFVLAFCVSPVGLLVSLIALAKPPRGFAIGGVVVGLLGTVAWSGGGFFFYKFVRPGIVWASGSAEDWQEISGAISQYQTDNGALPGALSDLGLSADVLEDPNGVAWRFETSDDSWTLIGAGMDETFDTDDDLAITSDLTEQDVTQAMSQAIGKYYENRFQK